MFVIACYFIFFFVCLEFQIIQFVITFTPIFFIEIPSIIPLSYQYLCVVSQQSWFGFFFCWINFPILPPPLVEVIGCSSAEGVLSLSFFCFIIFQTSWMLKINQQSWVVFFLLLLLLHWPPPPQVLSPWERTMIRPWSPWPSFQLRTSHRNWRSLGGGVSGFGDR